ncbi:MAG: hypothetical protein WC533_04080 [Candidatus Pacearchaeota archaeon]
MERKQHINKLTKGKEVIKDAMVFLTLMGSICTGDYLVGSEDNKMFLASGLFSGKVCLGYGMYCVFSKQIDYLQEEEKNR